MQAELRISWRATGTEENVMSRPKIAIILSTTREGRFGEKPAAWIKAIADRRSDLSFEVVDLRDWALPLFDEARSPAYGTSENAEARRWQAKLAEFDGYLFVTAEYNRSIPAALKNALDWAYGEWNRKPAAFLGYGPIGAARAVEQLRLMAIELQMAPTRSGVHITMDPYLAVVQGQKELADFDHLNKGAETMLNELAWWTHALRNARAADAERKAA
jgi:NAD(P)H-dependent FMN reductase